MQVLGYILISLFIIGVELLIPKFIQYFVDHLLPDGALDVFLLALGSLAGLVVLVIAFTLFRNRLQRYIQEKAARDMQFALFAHLRKLGFSYYEKNPVGQTLSLFNSEVKAVQEIYYRYFPGMVITGVTFLVCSAMMLSIHIGLSLVVIPCFLSYYLIGPYFEKQAARLGHETQVKRTAFQKKIYDTVSGLLELRAYQGEDWDTAQVMSKQHELHDKTNLLHFMSYARGLVRRVSVQFGAVAVFAYGAYLLSRDAVTTGALVAFMFYYFRMIQDITFLVTMTSEQKVLMNQVDRLFGFMKQQPDIRESESASSLLTVQGEIVFRNVAFRYDTQSELIKGFSLHIRPGEKVAFVGTSGNGKSTLLKLIGRFYDPTQGEICLDGIPLPKLSLKQIRGTMGFVFQETYLFGSTIRENIRFGAPDATDEQVEAAAKAAYAHDFIQQFPQGYDTFVGERGVRLSGGQRQRIAIARMFIKNPRIVLLDEATAALDNVSEWEVQQALNRLFEGRTIIAIAHRLSTVKGFDTIIVVDQGIIAEKGNYEQLMLQQGVFRRLAAGEERAVGE
ncbi:ABC transporter ATP-binding protein [Paenibacillus lautus]|uniref:ABC transporter ATP-binding protein n=1 Tax=Paenibacillus lautus TaxID=1401 RepID=UPI002350FE92|nr:ABC transporter ATP-binding protein [Paenibacillus lautus]